MRSILLTALVVPALIWALFSAQASVLVMNWLWFQRPYDFAFGFWNTLPMFQIAVAVTFVSHVIHRQLRIRFPALLVVYLLFLAWLTLSTLMAFNSEVAWTTYRMFLPSMWIAPVLMFATINDIELLKKVLWVAAGGLGCNAFKVGLVMTVKGGGSLSSQISGFVGDNNVFGLVLCLVVAILMGLKRTLPKRRGALPAFYGFVTVICLCIIYTKSRGALLSLIMILFCRALISSRPLSHSILLALIVGIGYVSVPAQYFDRLSTLGNVAADTSAMGRIQNWELSWEEAVDHPLFGVGPANHITYNRSRPHLIQTRVAHSIYFQILGELGFPALALYLLFVLMALGSLVSLWRFMIPVAREHPDLVWVKDAASWMTCGYIGFIFGSGLLNMLYIEFPWYVPFYGSMLGPLVRRELAARQATYRDAEPAVASSANVLVAPW